MTDKPRQRAEKVIDASEGIEDEVMDEVLNAYSDAIEDETLRPAKEAVGKEEN